MKSLMNRFQNSRLQLPAAAPSAGSTLRELTLQETTTVSGGLAFFIGAAIGLAIAIGTSGDDIPSGVTNFEYWEQRGVKFPR